MIDHDKLKYYSVYLEEIDALQQQIVRNRCLVLFPEHNNEWYRAFNSSVDRRWTYRIDRNYSNNHFDKNITTGITLFLQMLKDIWNEHKSSLNHQVKHMTLILNRSNHPQLCHWTIFKSICFCFRLDTVIWYSCLYVRILKWSSNDSNNCSNCH